MSGPLHEEVRRRASDQCEYCQMPQSLTQLTHELDHIRSEKHHGPTELPNLVWACALCNRAKGPDASGYVPGSENIVRLFHPRRDVWDDHFSWNGPILWGKTDIARATIEVLGINADARIEHREMLLMAGLFPPTTAA